ncbi:MAG TPA: type II CAAX endopeptidase family protein [Actinomycetota bacterium]|nr:type II CAAX endopeptidase family protein [Actinomycetota bacterium]
MAATPPPPITLAPRNIPQRPDLSWPLLDVGVREFLPMALVPFGIVMLTWSLVLGFLGWDGPGGGALVTALQQLALAVPIALWVRRGAGSLAPLGLRRGGWTRRDVGVGIGMGLVALLASVVVTAITVAIVEAIIGHAYEIPDPGFDQGAWFWAFAFMAVVMAPVCEEIYFRGFLFQGLRTWWRFAWAGLASGCSFAFVHVEPIRFFGLALTGVIFAAVFERRRTLVSSMCAHLVLNVVAVGFMIAGR